MLYSLKDDSNKLMFMFQPWWKYIEEILYVHSESYKNIDYEYFLLFVEKENFKKDVFFETFLPYIKNISYMLSSVKGNATKKTIKSVLQEMAAIKTADYYIVPIVISYNETLYENEEPYSGRGDYCIDILSTQGAEEFAFRFKTEQSRQQLIDELSKIGVEF